MEDEKPRKAPKHIKRHQQNKVAKKIAKKVRIATDGRPPRPGWMSVATYTSSFKKDKNSFKVILCKGCQQKFKSYGKGKPEFAYYLHCIEQCHKYRELAMISSCQPCGLKFLDAFAHQRHLRSHNEKKANGDGKAKSKGRSPSKYTRSSRAASGKSAKKIENDHSETER